MQNYQLSNSNLRVYLDNNATTFPSDLLKSKWAELLEISGNPSSVHHEGRLPKTILRDTRKKIADLLNCSALDIVFNSGASEGNSSILNSVFQVLKDTRNEYLISSVEHPSLIKAAENLKTQGAVIHLIPVDRNGRIDMEFIKSKLSSKTALVSVMYANNETGVIFPIAEISELAHAHGALMHSDCVQLVGKADLTDFKSLNLDYATFSAHKFYALKGTGFCFIKNSSPWQTLIFGSQERSRRGGTENITGIAAMGIVLDELKNIDEKVKQLTYLRDLFEKLVIEKISGVSITAQTAKRVSNTSSLVISDVDGDTMLMSLDIKGFSVSTGAACSSGSPEPSPILLAMGLTRAEAQSSLRVSVGWKNTEDEIRSFVDCLVEVVNKLRAMNVTQKNREYVS
ncbi:MAG: cysteine desulfurase family protein [Pseudobdellovibrio sp.]